MHLKHKQDDAVTETLIYNALTTLREEENVFVALDRGYSLNAGKWLNGCELNPPTSQAEEELQSEVRASADRNADSDMLASRDVTLSLPLPLPDVSKRFILRKG